MVEFTIDVLHPKKNLFPTKHLLGVRECKERERIRFSRREW